MPTYGVLNKSNSGTRKEFASKNISVQPRAFTATFTPSNQQPTGRFLLAAVGIGGQCWLDSLRSPIAIHFNNRALKCHSQAQQLTRLQFKCATWESEFFLAHLSQVHQLFALFHESDPYRPRLNSKKRGSITRVLNHQTHHTNIFNQNAITIKPYGDLHSYRIREDSNTARCKIVRTSTCSQYMKINRKISKLRYKVRRLK